MIMQHIFVTCLFLAQSFLPLDANGLGDLAKILAALSGEVECSFKCPSGKPSRFRENETFKFRDLSTKL